ncbi:MAG: hypothetical protein HQK79_02505 [Desulfobacterales bacterium]|nr:hypothetical protein [Desulfobacterales bacterium]MBF0396509.1 hypothetical protein [Desulfobacterales bacterium]
MKINCFLSNFDHPVSEDKEIWKKSFPISYLKSKNDDKFTYGDYFNAVLLYIEKQGLKVISDIIKNKCKSINIFLEKHGAFYHPARIEIIDDYRSYFFVLNVAVSDSGKNCLKREYNILKRLNEEFKHSFVPKAYDIGNINENINMFLGEWFDGYNEFHMTKNGDIIVWDNNLGNFTLSKEQKKELYTKASKILTYYYNIETFEQIFPWHHASGDFIVKCKKDELDLKLITVRNYAPLFYNPEEGEESSLQGLLLFLINLSIRMRLDRIDGVEDIIWGDDSSIHGALKGFFEGLKLKNRNELIPYFKTLNCSYIYDLALEIVESYNQMSSDVEIIRKNIGSHIKEFCENCYGIC